MAEGRVGGRVCGWCLRRSWSLFQMAEPLDVVICSLKACKRLLVCDHVQPLGLSGRVLWILRRQDPDGVSWLRR